VDNSRILNLTKPSYWHFWISSLLCAAIIPVLRSQNLPLKFDWVTLAVAFWLVLAAQAVFLAAILWTISLPQGQAWKTFKERYRNPLRIIVVLCYFAVLVWATTTLRALVLTVGTVALLEFIHHEREKSKGLKQALIAVFVPSAYLFFGFLLVLAYNCAIDSARFNFATDPALAAIDRWLLHGHSVWDLTRWALQTLPLSFFQFLEFIYFGMFPQIGATIILVALCEGRARALQFVGTILMSYYLALVIFYLWPAQGPYYLSPVELPASLKSYTIQRTLIPHALALWHHQPISRISTDYFIAFPCMHIVQPLIVLWFLRPWRRVVIALAAYDVLIVIAVIVLEMHYVIDVLVGLLVAAVAVTITAGPLQSQMPRASNATARAVG
jgi:hypothetical protein